MLVEFAIELDAIDNSVSPAHIGRLLEMWERFGILVFPDYNDDSVKRRIKSLEPSPRKMWQAAWVRIRKSRSNRFRTRPFIGEALNWDVIDTPSALAEYSDKFNVVLLEETRAIVLNIPEGSSEYFGDVEGIRLGDIDVSEKFRRSKALSSMPVRVNKSTQNLWLERFQKFASNSKHIVIVDQWAIRYDNSGGLIRLLRFIDRDGCECQVTVYSSPRLEADPAEMSSIDKMLRDVISTFSDGGVKGISIRLFPEDDFRIYAHDRHIRFDSSVFNIGRGVRIFEYDAMREATTVILTTLDAGRIAEEKELNLDRKAYLIREFSYDLV